MPRLSDRDVDSVPGAFWAPDLEMFRVLLRATGTRPGDLAELGVLFGRSAVLIGDHQQTGETFTVVDLFGAPAPDDDNDTENRDSYPTLTRTEFEGHYRRLLPDLPVVVEGLSQDIADHAAHGTHRFVHIDASHLHEHVVGDLAATRTLLRPDGVVVLDDFRGEHTPGVAAAAWQEVVTSGMRPFAVSPHKMYATWGDPVPWRAALQDWVAGSGLEHETQRVNGDDLLRVRARTVAGPHPAKKYVPEVLWPTLARLRSRGR